MAEEAAQLRQKYTALEANYGTLQRNLDEVSEELSAQHQTLEAKSHELVECQLRERIASEKVTSLQKSLIAAEDKVVALRADYLFILQEKINLGG